MRDDQGNAAIHNIPGTPIDADMPLLADWSRDQLKSDPVRLSVRQARPLAEQFLETARIRGWNLLALAVVTNHIHIVVGVIGDPSPSKLLNDFKSYGTRALNQVERNSRRDSWWTDSGSKRKPSGEDSILGAIRYTIEQEGALVVWTAVIPELNLVGGYLKG